MTRTALCVGAVLLVLAGCGQKGPLYLPDSPPQAVPVPVPVTVPAPAPATATVPAADDEAHRKLPRTPDPATSQ